MEGPRYVSSSSPRGAKRSKKKLAGIIILILTIVIVLSIILIFNPFSEDESGTITIKIFYEGDWEGTVVFYDNSQELDEKVEANDYEEVKGLGDKVLTYPMPGKNYISVSFWVTDGSGEPINVEIWINGQIKAQSGPDWGLPNYYCALSLKD